MTEKTRILIIGEGVTLAHVGRPLVVAKALAEAGYDVTFACDKRFLPMIDLNGLRHVAITSLDSKLFVKRVTSGKPLFTVSELKAMVEEDVRVLNEIKPALVIGDLRWSLGISARLAKISYAAISNAYWSPYAANPQWVLPAHSILQHLHFGFFTMQAVFRLVRPIAFALLSLPGNIARKHYNRPSTGWDIRAQHEDADFVLFPDMPELHLTRHLPPTHRYIGPIHWSPSVPLPEWWKTLRDDVPVIYVNLGSSGDATLLPMILNALAALPVQVIAATAGKNQIVSPAPNVFLADFLPGDVCVKCAALAITNGGSMTVYQAVIEGGGAAAGHRQPSRPAFKHETRGRRRRGNAALRAVRHAGSSDGNGKKYTGRSLIRAKRPPAAEPLRRGLRQCAAAGDGKGYRGGRS